MIATEQGLVVKQTRFVMPIADDVRLVTVDTARAVAGVTAEQIIERCEDQLSADWLPAFDVSLGGNGHSGTERRELRIWAKALKCSVEPVAQPVGPQARRYSLESIVADCLLTNAAGVTNPNFNLNASQLERAWCVSNQTILRLIGCAELKGVRVGRNWKVNRLSAANFLRRRAL